MNDKPVKPIEFPSPVTLKLYDIISNHYNSNMNDAFVLINLELILITSSTAFMNNTMTKEEVKKLIYDMLKEVQESVDSLVDQMYQFVNDKNLNK